MEIKTRELNELCKNSLIHHIGIEFIELGKGFIKAKMPVDSRTMQPMGRLHGGAIMALAETVGSAGSYLIVDRDKYDVVGMEINGNHIGNTKSSYVIATGEIVHKGSKTHVWNIRIIDKENNPVSICRMTNMIITKEK